MKNYSVFKLCCRHHILDYKLVRQSTSIRLEFALENLCHSFLSYHSNFCYNKFSKKNILFIYTFHINLYEDVNKVFTF